MTVDDTFDLIGKLVQTKCNEKKDWIDQHTKTLSELPLHKINDDIFDVDSEVLKSEKHWLEFVIEDVRKDVKELLTINEQYASALELKGNIEEFENFMGFIKTIGTLRNSVQTMCNPKMKCGEQYTKTLSELPLHKINDDIFDVDSEVLKSEKHWLEFVIKDGISDVKDFATIDLQCDSILKTLLKIMTENRQ